MRRFVVGVMTAMLVGCGGGSATPGGAPQPVRGSADRITEAEINAGVYQQALEVIQNLRPSMLIRRGTVSGFVPVVAYMDNVRLVELNSLSTIPANQIREIRFINARDATTRYGTGHASGVILVTMKRD
ncbi:MAG TPA: hypothetical protein VF981_02020 [Gemmatimonadaceae bacterium]